MIDQWCTYRNTCVWYTHGMYTQTDGRACMQIYRHTYLMWIWSPAIYPTKLVGSFEQNPVKCACGAQPFCHGATLNRRSYSRNSRRPIRTWSRTAGAVSTPSGWSVEGSRGQSTGQRLIILIALSHSLLETCCFLKSFCHGSVCCYFLVKKCYWGIWWIASFFFNVNVRGWRCGGLQLPT